MSLVKTSLLTSFSQVVNILFKLIINKVIALFLGPSAYSYIGQFQNFISTLSALSSCGFSTGVTTLTAQERDNKSTQKEVWNTAIAFCMICSIGLVVLIALFSNKFALSLFAESDFQSIILFSTFFIPILGLNLIFTSIFTGIGNIKTVIKANLITSFFYLISFTIGAIYFGIKGTLFVVEKILDTITLLSILITQLCTFLYLLYNLKSKYDFLKAISKIRLNSSITSKLYPFMYMTLATSIISPISLIIIRSNIISSFGIDQAGMWDAINRISSILLVFFTSPIQIYLLPKFSTISNTSKRYKKMIQFYKLIIPVSFLATFGIYVFRRLIISILFSDEFITMEALFTTQMIGDFFRILSIMPTFFLISLSDYKRFISSEIIFSFGYIFLTFKISSLNNSIISATFSYMVINIITFLFLIFLTKSLSNGKQIFKKL